MAEGSKAHRSRHRPRHGPPQSRSLQLLRPDELLRRVDERASASLLGERPDEEREDSDNCHGGEDEGGDPVPFGLDGEEGEGDGPENEEADLERREKVQLVARRLEGGREGTMGERTD
jgi:hypothetical protein